MPLRMSRVPQEAFFSTARIFRTVGGPLRYRMPQTAERRRALPAANATTARKEEPSAKSATRGAAASKKITAKKFAIPPQICSTPPGRADVAKIHSMPPQKKLLSAPGIFADCYRLSLPTPRGWVVVAGCKDLPIQTPNDSHKGLSFIFGAENGTRTRDLNLGKVALYQLSYFRNITPYLAVGITKVRSFFLFANYF